MNRWAAVVCGVLGVCVLTSCETLRVGDLAGAVLGGEGGELTLREIVAGLKQALEVGTGNAVETVSAEGGFSGDPRLRIPPPEKLAKVLDTMRKVGLGRYADDFETRLNTAAEQAAAKATPVFVRAIGQMSFEDARGILQGGETAATEYFRRTAGSDLEGVFKPVVHRHMEEVGLVRVYNDLVDRYAALPLTKRPDFDLDAYVTGKTVDGLFTVLADEEAKIRRDPAARTTALLRRVFGR